MTLSRAAHHFVVVSLPGSRMSILEIDSVMGREVGRRPHDPQFKCGSAFMSGHFCSLDEAMMPVLDLGFLQCDVTYEKVTVAKGCFFRLDDHFARFSRSCAKFRLKNPHTNEEMRRILSKLVSLTGLSNGGVFFCVTRGLARKASDRPNPDIFENRFYAIVDGYESIATAEQRQKGLSVIVSKRHIRIPPKAVDPTAKNFHGQDMKLAMFEAHDLGADWPILTDADGYLTEAAGANVFLVKKGELLTPDSGCLEGITRQSVLELAETLGIPVRVQRVHVREVQEADDAFITSSAGGVMPINSIDGRRLGDTEGPGRVATQLHNRYWEKMWAGWKCSAVQYESDRHSAEA
jgi:branched-chain amino acid aminotransferase